MPPPTRHSVYYFTNGTHIFRVCAKLFAPIPQFVLMCWPKVENTLYKLYNDLLVTHSALFEDMFTIGDTTTMAKCDSQTAEGKCDTEPIFLEGEKQATFDLFLDHIHGR